MRYTRPALDVVYFMTSSTSPAFRKTFLNSMLQLYHQQFVSELKSLGDNDEEVYSFNQFLEDYNDCFPWGLVLGLLHAQLFFDHLSLGKVFIF